MLRVSVTLELALLRVLARAKAELDVAGSKGLRHHNTSSWFVGLSNDTSSPRLAGMWPATKGKVFGACGKRATTRKPALAGECSRCW